MALGALATLRQLHPLQLTSAAYGVLINGCAREGREADGLDVFGLLRLDWQTTGNQALHPTTFVYRCGKASTLTMIAKVCLKA